jgi:hypothetical protein
MADERGAAAKEAEMREHERQARERDGDERSPEDSADSEDARAGKPAPPGNIDVGGGVAGGS